MIQNIKFGTKKYVCLTWSTREVHIKATGTLPPVKTPFTGNTAALLHAGETVPIKRACEVVNVLLRRAYAEEWISHHEMTRGIRLVDDWRRQRLIPAQSPGVLFSS